MKQMTAAIFLDELFEEPKIQPTLPKSILRIEIS